MQTYSIIACVDNKYGISKNGIIPWKIQEDSNYFLDMIKYKFTNHKNILLMGYNTFLQCGLGLTKDCIYVVITSHTIESNNNQELYQVRSVNDAIDLISKNYPESHVFVCGGSRIYNEFYSIKVNKSKLINVDELINYIDYDYNCDNFLTDDYKTYVNININSSIKLNTIDVKDNNKNVIIYINNTFKNTFKNRDEDTYKSLILDILNGEKRLTRNAYVYSVFGRMLRFNLDRFPLLTTKRMFLVGIFEELMFFIRGQTDSSLLSSKGVKIWDGNTSREFLDKMGFTDRKVGDMGPMYGYQLRNFNKKYNGDNGDNGFDQLNYCLDLLRNDPHSRRIIMTTYNPLQAFEGVLFPCHGITIMFNTKYISDNRYKLNLMMTQRSCDYFLGVPFNIASYALLVYIICDKLNNEENCKYKYEAGELIMNLGDTHIYDDHKQQALRQLLRTSYDFPKLEIINHPKNIEDYKLDDIKLIDYNCHNGLIAKMIA